MIKEKLYEGKAKILYPTDDPEIYLAHYKDDATAFNAQKRGQIQGKGEINCTIASALFQWLESLGIPTHYIDQPSAHQMLVCAVQIIPLEVVVRNIAAGSLCKQTGLTEGTILPFPLVEFYLKDDALGDPLLTRDRIMILEVATPAQLEQLQQLALTINQHLIDFFKMCDITLVDFKLEFGLDKENKIRLADEISPDTCRLWDNKEIDPQARILDKDRFRRDLGKIEDAYQDVQQRVLTQIAKLQS
ncbi:phosphoribosylaminoimidazolesuccinocarboxamide synthase [Aphanothece hegewaldii CCALA 016]|uniref:Phosphoribosylaminoimidazole-succinocarboxamide synthase n=1 Tax=Aphanothece hegewaldii CCALA 016 TaxID=2107694 RepID=A0A2T1LSX7_9CHRO|nr:phosphoribosylaminoimidazolesuccinocarboxamide synthase [Aphanothece hegewaldii]PSF33099.1 phosphoribosylaminoimidazolesuccinocarboxamide synthase [Aphanothece hegewaldii CCALA 016]